MGQRKVSAWACDGCGKIEIPGTDEDPPPGLSGNVMEVHLGGGSGGEWYACSRRCIRKAIVSVLDRPWNETE